MDVSFCVWLGTTTIRSPLAQPVYRSFPPFFCDPCRPSFVNGGILRVEEVVPPTVVAPPSYTGGQVVEAGDHFTLSNPVREMVSGTILLRVGKHGGNRGRPRNGT